MSWHAERGTQRAQGPDLFEPLALALSPMIEGQSFQILKDLKPTATNEPPETSRNGNLQHQRLFNASSRIFKALQRIFNGYSREVLATPTWGSARACCLL